MFENCSSHQNCNCGKRSASVIGKLTKVFGHRKTYRVQKVQQLNEVLLTELVESSNSWVTVHSLQSQSDGGILDPDDRLRDVADDREQIIALYDDGDSISPHQHVVGDGASHTSSPDMFHSRDGLQTDIEVTNELIASGFPALHVRRGSEPALNQLPLENANNLGKRTSNLRPPASGQSKRWSAAPMIHDPKEKLRTGDYTKINGFGLSDKWRCSEEDEYQIEFCDDKPPISNHFLAPFHRDSPNRLSMQYLGESSSGFRWAESADLANNRALSLSLPRDHRRKEPLGQANTNPSSRLLEPQNTEYIVLSTGDGTLGIHVVPDYDDLGKERGLLVQFIEPGGRVHCDGRLKVYDRIVEINGRSLLGQKFNALQEIFRDSLHSSELKLRVIKHKNNMDVQTSQNMAVSNKKHPPPPVFPKPSTNTSTPFSNKENVSSGISKENRKLNSNAKIATISPTKKPSTAAAHTASNILMVANTRKIGKKIELELTKGPHGLGFSITTRDNPAGGNCPIYIKNVLSKGAAVEDGRLRPGDRLLAVNGTELTGKTQAEAVSVLRKVPSGAKVKIIVSRQEDVIQGTQKSNQELDDNYEQEIINSSENLSKNTNSKTNSPNIVQEYIKSLEETQTFPWRHKELLTFDIPVHDSEKAGLGISVKGKTSSNNNSNDKDISQDLGIFIKNVIHGGAASRDGRLRTNDQLLYINGISLIGQNNTTAMETLRRTMLNVEPSPTPGTISLTVARRRSNSPSLNKRQNRDSSSSLTDSSANTETFGRGEMTNDNSTQNTTDNSGTSQSSDNTVIFMHQRQGSESSKLQLTVATSPDGITIRNPVLERLTGHTNRLNALRNESYYKATHQTTIMMKEDEQLNSPTVNQSSDELLIIEEDPPFYNNTNRKKIEEDSIPVSLPQTRTGSTSTDVTYASQLSLDNANSGFSRDAFGRQSMSEKRHATLDAKNTDTYQRNKKLREDNKCRNSLPSKNQLGPALGMKKSSSLESLQTMVQEVQMSDGGTKRNMKVVRGRGCDDSFRAAIDMESPLSLHELCLETYDKDSDHQIGLKQSTLHSQIDHKVTPPLVSNKKKPGLLKGIGSMFRFGKPRRVPDLNSTLSSEEETADREREIARRNARNEQQKIREHYKRIIQQQAELQEQNHCREVPINDNTANYSMTTKLSNPEQSRIDRIQLLRAEHQRRHLERSGKYIPEEREANNYESDIHQIPNSQNVINRPGSRVGIIDSARFNHYVNFQEIQQNLSLMHGIENYGVKLRNHSKTKKHVMSCYYDTDYESRRQLHYHSQRRDSKESVTRPSSNYYEYESVMRSLPYTSDSSTSRLVDNNSLTRHSGGDVTKASKNNNMNNNPAQQKSSRHHYPMTKSSNYTTYNSFSEDGPGGQNGSTKQLQSSRKVSTNNNNNYADGVHHHYNEEQQRPSQQGPYITQVTIRDNQHIIQSPNI